MRRRRPIPALLPALLALAGASHAAAGDDDPNAPSVCSPPCAEGQTCVGRTCEGAGAPTLAPGPTPAPPAGSAPTSGPQADRDPGPAPGQAAATADAARRPPAPPPRLVHDDSSERGAQPPPPRDRLQRGFVALLYAGLHSYQHSEASGHGPGLRIGMLVGGHLNDRLSLNGEVTFDLSRIDRPPDPYYPAREWVLDAVFSPLFRLPVRSLHLVLGPKLGLFVVSSQTPTSTGKVLGYTLGGNAGLFLPVSPAISFGALLSLGLRQAIQDCPTFAGTFVSCGAIGTDGFAQVVGLTAAAMF